LHPAVAHPFGAGAGVRGRAELLRDPELAVGLALDEDALLAGAVAESDDGLATDEAELDTLLAVLLGLGDGAGEPVPCPSVADEVQAATVARPATRTAARRADGRRRSMARILPGE
jgi:hypothetical protein